MANIDVVMEQLKCTGVTDSIPLVGGGDDEFYYFLGASVRDANGVAVGNPIGLRGPGVGQGADADNDTAWDMNASDKSVRNFNAIMATLQVNPGQSALILITFHESDNTKTASDVVAAAGKIGGAVAAFAGAGPIGGLISAGISALSSFIPVNQDDHLGAVSFKLEGSNGNVVLTEQGFWSANTKIWGQSQPGVSPYTTTLHLYGDGSNYYPLLRLDGVENAPGSTQSPW
jgi:hypothetical protein